MSSLPDYPTTSQVEDERSDGPSSVNHPTKIILAIEEGMQ